MSDHAGHRDSTLPPLPGDATLPPAHDGAPAAPTPVGPTPPGYEILGELGRGGMGLVYKARQRGLNRLVALKMILAGGHAGGTDLARFRGEAEAIARLRHPSIVQIYEVGECGGLPYFSLEYCPAGSLDRKLNGTPLPMREAAALVEKLARGIQEAHAKGILHRDLKPANVLLAEDGTPMVTDFGLAKRLDVPSGQTQSGAILGTPSYMAPEQAAGKVREIGPATDVYGLGAILYELLTGRPPFRAATPLDTLLQSLENHPAPVRLLNPQVDRDLETICMKCLEKAPAHRYPSADSLADDLQRFGAGEPISARSINILERMTRTLQRSQIDAGYESWGTILLWFAAIVFGTQIGVFAVIMTRQHEAIVHVTRNTQFVLMGLVMWRLRSPQLFVRTPATRQLWSLWVGFLIACSAIGVVSQLVVRRERMFDVFHYPYWSVLSGFAFVAMGGSHWGWFYAFGGAFFALSILLAFLPLAGPFAFGFLWALSLTVLGLRLRKMARPG